jgi:hypothetical protein
VKSLAEHASNVVSGCPYADRASYLHEIDSLILELEQALASDGGLPAPAEPHDAGGESGVGAGPRQAGPEFGAARH